MYFFAGIGNCFELWIADVSEKRISVREASAAAILSASFGRLPSV